MEDVKQQEEVDSDDSDYYSDDSRDSGQLKSGRKPKKSGSKKERKGRGQGKSEQKVRVIERGWGVITSILPKTYLYVYL